MNFWTKVITVVAIAVILASVAGYWAVSYQNIDAGYAGVVLEWRKPVNVVGAGRNQITPIVDDIEPVNIGIQMVVVREDASTHDLQNVTTEVTLNFHIQTEDAIWTADMDEQIEACCDLEKQIDYEKLLVTYGSAYHTKENLNCDQAFAKRMNAVAHGHELSFQPQGQKDIFHLSHAVGVSTSVWIYRTTALAKELVAALLNEKELHNYRGIIRSHAHYYCKVGFSNTFALITPCWQGRTPYMIRKGLALIPKLGWIVLDNDTGDWRISENCFDMPRPNKVVV